MAFPLPLTFASLCCLGTEGLKQAKGRKVHLGHVLISQSTVEEEKADFHKFLLAWYGARCLCV